MSTRRAVAALALVIAAVGCRKDPPPPGPADAASSARSAAPTTSGLTIPARPLDGKVGGRAFTPKKVAMVTAKGFDEWRVTIEGAVAGGESAALRFPIRAPLAAGKSVEVQSSGIVPGAKTLAVNVQSGSGSTTSTVVSYRLEITRWDVKPCPSDDAPRHEGGVASGRLVLRVPSEDVEIGGVFEDAVVTYGATPDWAYR